MKKNNILGLGAIMSLTTITTVVSCNNTTSDKNNKQPNSFNEYGSQEKFKLERNEVTKKSLEEIRSKHTLMNKNIEKELIDNIYNNLPGISNDDAESIFIILYDSMIDMINYFNDNIIVLETFKTSSIIFDLSIIPKYNKYVEILDEMEELKNSIQEIDNGFDTQEIHKLFTDALQITVNNTYNQKTKSFIEGSYNKEYESWINLLRG